MNSCLRVNQIRRNLVEMWIKQLEASEKIHFQALHANESNCILKSGKGMF